MDAAVAQPRRWTRSEYDQMIDAGVFRPDEHLELLQGEILPMTPQRSAHANAVSILSRRFERTVGDDVVVRTQLPLSLSQESVPEPDLALVAGDPADFWSGHPTRADLIVEVADSSLRRDRLLKGLIYAEAGIPEYWILNLEERILEVYREPVCLDGVWTYRLIQRFGREDTVSPIVRPNVTLWVGDLLPPK